MEESERIYKDCDNMDSYELVCQKSEEITGKGFEIKAECDSENEWGDFNSCWATLTFYKDGEVIKWNEEVFEELVDRLDLTYLGEDKYEIINNESVYMEVYNGFDEELQEYVGISGLNKESKNILNEHLQDVKEMYEKNIKR